MWNWLSFDRIRQDLQYAGRRLCRDRAFFGVAVVTLALGIGVTSTVFCVIDAVVLRPLPYPHPEQLVMLHDTLGDARDFLNLASPGQFVDWSEQNHSFVELGAYTDALFNMGDQNPVRINAVMATPGLLRTLGITLSRGRLFGQQEWMLGLDPSDVVLVSWDLWNERFGNERLSNQTISLGSERYDVIGVLPQTFFFLGKKVDAIVPIRFPSAADQRAFRGFRYLTVIGRLREGVTKEKALRDMEAIAANLSDRYPSTDSGRTITLTDLFSAVLGPSRPGFLLLSVAVGSLLLVSCINVSSLLVARGVERRKEIAIMLALGAGWRDLCQQVLVEAFLIAGVAAALGLGLAQLLLSLFLAVGPNDLPRFGDSAINLKVTAFAAALGLMAAITLVVFSFGTLLGKRNLLTDLAEVRSVSAGLTGVRTRSLMLIAEIALAAFLTSGAGLTVKALVRLLDTDPGFRREGAIAMDISLSKDYSDEERSLFFQRLLESVRELPGVEAVGITNRLPLSGDTSTRIFNFGSIPSPNKQQMLEFRTISPGFAQAMGMRLMKGRLIDEQDSQFSPAVAMVNESFVSRYSPDQSVLERTILIQDGVSSRPRRIVGVVNNVKNTSMSVEAKAEAYVPYVERPYANMSIVVRTRTPAQSLSNSVRRVLAKLDPRIPLANVRSLNEFVLSATSLERFRAFLMSAFSFCALLLSAVGIYGVTSYSMSRRRVEFGVRIALGARRWDIMILVLSWATRLAAYGVIVGVVLAMGAAQIVRRLLYQVSSFDFWTFSAVAIVLAGIALLASLVPAFRAAKISPASTLRC